MPGTCPTCCFSEHSRTWACRRLSIALLIACFLAIPKPVVADIMGDTGNEPRTVAGWPVGAAAVFNAKERVAWWEGPPFGGGQWHGEFRGDAEGFNRVLKNFARIDAKVKRLVVHNGIGRSFWLNPNREKAKEGESQVDWVFVVWDVGRWQQLQGMPADLRPRSRQGAADKRVDLPVPQIDLYTGGNIRFKDVKVPDGIEVVDERLEAHGFRPEDGTVLEGVVIDLATQQPLTAKVELEAMESSPQGGYKYTSVARISTDKTGRWVIKSAPSGRHRVVVHADDYVSRVVGHHQIDGGPLWIESNTGLARRAAVAGQVTDADGKPLEGVRVRLSNVVAEQGGRYESPAGYEITTDEKGRFVVKEVPVGTASVHVYKEGYCRPGLGPKITMPAKDVVLTMIRAATIQVTVDFSKAVRPKGYIVQIEPAEGGGVGSWGGSGNIDAKGQIQFKNVPPGTYVLKGRPNPGAARDETDPVLIELTGGEEWAATLTAK